MKITLTVGEWEKHVIHFEHHKWTGMARLVIDGVEIQKKFFMAGLHKVVEVGEKEKHTVSIKYGIKEYLLGGPPVIVIDGKPFLSEKPTVLPILNNLKEDKDQFKHRWRFSMDAKDYGILAGGILASVLGIILARLLARWDFVLISFLAFGFLPLGSAALGMASASGFFLTAWLMQRKMSLMAAFLMVAILIPAYFGHYHVAYQQLTTETQEGEIVPLREVVSFWEYYKWNLTTRIYKWDNGPEESNPAGKWGYLYGGLEFLCFVMGGIIMLIKFSKIRYCESCQKYFKNKALLHTTDTSVAQESKKIIEEKNEFSFLEHYQGWTQFAVKQFYEVFLLDLDFCPHCHANSILMLKLRKTHDAEKLCEMEISAETAFKLLGKS